jgi:hypothetical protein
VNTTAAIAALAAIWVLGLLSLALSLPEGFWTTAPDDIETRTQQGSQTHSKLDEAKPDTSPKTSATDHRRRSLGG